MYDVFAPESEYLTTQQVAHLAYCSSQTVTRAIREQELPAFKIRRRWLISQENAKKFAAAKRTDEPTPEERIQILAQSIATQAPPLTDDQKARLRTLLV